MAKDLDLAVFISSAGPNVQFDNITDTVNSIRKNVGDYKLGFYFVADNPVTIAHFATLLPPDLVLGTECTSASWAKTFNSFFDRFKDKAEYILISHDDLEITTDNFLGRALAEISGMENEVGWITFTSDGYRKKGIPMVNSVREGFALDRHRYPYVFECHKYASGDVFNEGSRHLLDYPERAIKVHAIFPHIMLVKSDNLSKIGYCEDWTPYTLLIDEDWGMEALRKGLWNIWIPNIFYTHPLRYEKRKQEGIRYEPQAHSAFAKKWGFYFGSTTYSDDFIKSICTQYAGTNIPLSAGKNTYEWQYLKP